MPSCIRSGPCTRRTTRASSLVPTAELPYYRIAWDRSSRRHDEGSFDEHAPLVAELLDRIRANGELSSTDVEPRAAIEWYWRPTNQVRALLEALGEAGVLGLSRRAGNRRYYDLVERLFPAGLLAERRDEHDQLQHKLLSRFRAHGLLGRAGQGEIWLGLGKAVVQPGDPPWKSRTALRAELIEVGRDRADRGRGDQGRALRPGRRASDAR